MILNRIADAGDGGCAGSHPGFQVIRDPESVCDNGEGRIDRGARRKEAAVDDVEIVYFVTAAIQIQRGCGGIYAKPDGAADLARRGGFRTLVGRSGGSVR